MCPLFPDLILAQNEIQMLRECDFVMFEKMFQIVAIHECSKFQMKKLKVMNDQYLISRLISGISFQ